MFDRIIVEGPDGAGKTTVLNRLAIGLNLKKHSRASDSKLGPVAQLDRWVTADTRLVTNPYLPPDPYIYDRHPLISEPIYGWIVRKQPKRMFDRETWVHRMSERNSIGAIVVLCLPPWEVVLGNVHCSDDGQMPGVVDNIREIYDAYASLRWPGPVITYDYTVMRYTHLENLLRPLMRSPK